MQASVKESGARKPYVPNVIFGEDAPFMAFAPCPQTFPTCLAK